MSSKLFICIALISAVSSVPISNLINDGIIPDEGEFPFVAAVRRADSTQSYKCGGAIISNRHILTSAECIESNAAEQIFVVVGNNQKEKVKKITPHFLYSDKKNNIAILELERTLETTNLVKPVNFNTTYDLDNEEVTALGIQKPTNVSLVLN